MSDIAADPNDMVNIDDTRTSENFFPAANITRIAKKIVPSHAKISKEAIALIQEKVYDFISFISSEAGAQCISSNRRTVKGDDIINALDSLGFDEYAKLLRIYLSKVKDNVDEPRPGKRAKPEESKPVVSDSNLPPQTE